MTPHVLIIAYGNPLRSDDGFAWHVADLLRGKLSSDNVKIICVHQLTPELAEPASHAERVIFLDARVNGEPGHIYRAQVAREAENPACTHALSPAQLLVLSGLLYGAAPGAYEVSVTGESFTHGEQLSHKVKNALPQVVEIIEQLTGQISRWPMETLACRVTPALVETAGTIFREN